MELEEEMAEHYQAPAGLLFNSGYQANLGLISALGGRRTTLIYDERIHASMRDGIRLALGRGFSFAHNDHRALEDKLSKAEGTTFVLIEGLYSMDGDEADLAAVLDLAERYDASVVLDEAHSNGVLGPSGRGVAVRDGLAERTFARIFPFGKAFAQQGAFVCGSDLLRDYLISNARSFIYSTAPSFPALTALRESFRWGVQAEGARNGLFQRIEHFRDRAMREDLPIIKGAKGPVQGVLVEGNEAVMDLERYLWEHGLAVKGIRKPTVPEGSERLRIVLHADTPFERIDRALDLMKERL
jgi:8-amino-7-oxononanoate synthase